MTEKNSDQIKALYTELSKVAPSQDWEKILKISKKILGLSVNEKKAFQTKIICLINLEKFDEALTSIERFNNVNDFYFEKAYCAYRLNKTEDAYSILKQCDQMGVKEKELLAQVAYRLEKYQESYDCYRDIMKNLNDDFDNERQTNLSAVVASIQSTGTLKKDIDMSENEKKTFELCYNSACISISKEKYGEALEKLKRAEIMCRKTFEDDLDNPEDQEAFDREIAIIKAQYSFCLQKMGKIDESLKTYNSVLKTKKADPGITAVISNNLICINKDQNVFDSKKRIKIATSQEVESKLNSLQRRIIAYNEVLFYITINQNESVQKLLKKFELKFNDKERFVLLKMAQLYREKKYNEAEKLLIDLKKDTSSVAIIFYLLQILLLQGKTEEATALFKELDEFKAYKLGIISSVVTLLNDKHKVDEITQLFEGAIEYFKKAKPNSKEYEICIRENSNFQLQSNNLKNACELLEKLRVLKPKDYRILSKLINVYSKFDNEKAKSLSNELPSLEDIVANSNIDIESLENQFSSLSFKYSKSKSQVGTGQLKSPDKINSNQTAEKLKKKRKRKIQLPKNFDPNAPIDQERWLPLRERSYYKGRRNKKKTGVGKGTQGAVSGKESSSIQPQSPKPGTVAEQAAPPLDKLKAKPTSSLHQKKKKKGGSKW